MELYNSSSLPSLPQFCCWRMEGCKSHYMVIVLHLNILWSSIFPILLAVSTLWAQKEFQLSILQVFIECLKRSNICRWDKWGKIQYDKISIENYRKSEGETSIHWISSYSHIIPTFQEVAFPLISFKVQLYRTDRPDNSIGKIIRDYSNSCKSSSYEKRIKPSPVTFYLTSFCPLSLTM